MAENVKPILERQGTMIIFDGITKNQKKKIENAPTRPAVPKLSSIAAHYK